MDIIESLRRHLSTLWGSAQRTEAKLDGARAKQSRSEREIIAAVWIAASMVVVACLVTTLLLVSFLRTGSSNDSGALQEEKQAEQAFVSAGLNVGTKLVELVRWALPITKSALPGQMPAPCPFSVEEMNGRCWLKVRLTPAEVRAGACDALGLYEPSEGWCRANHAGYLPWLGERRRDRHAVDPR